MAKTRKKDDLLSTWTTQKLKSQAQSLHDLIYNVECFGTRDILELEMIERELNRRGYEFDDTKQLTIVKT